MGPFLVLASVWRHSFVFHTCIVKTVDGKLDLRVLTGGAEEWAANQLEHVVEKMRWQKIFKNIWWEKEVTTEVLVTMAIKKWFTMTVWKGDKVILLTIKFWEDVLQKESFGEPSDEIKEKEVWGSREVKRKSLGMEWVFYPFSNKCYLMISVARALKLWWGTQGQDNRNRCIR